MPFSESTTTTTCYLIIEFSFPVIIPDKDKGIKIKKANLFYFLFLTQLYAPVKSTTSGSMPLHIKEQDQAYKSVMCFFT
jgi:hypothetical protein